MEKQIILAIAIVFVVMFTSCEVPTTIKKQATSEYQYKSLICDVQIITIDSCEYIVAQTGTFDGGLCIIHKQNCTNCTKK
jgi:hypothetical protein